MKKLFALAMLTITSLALCNYELPTADQFTALIEASVQIPDDNWPSDICTEKTEADVGRDLYMAYMNADENHFETYNDIIEAKGFGSKMNKILIACSTIDLVDLTH